MSDLETSMPHIDAEQQTEMVRRRNESVAEKATMRDRAGMTRLFGGCELVEPGVVRVAGWRPGLRPRSGPAHGPVGRRGPKARS